MGRKRGQGTFLLTIAGVVANLRAMPRAARDSLGGYCYQAGKGDRAVQVTVYGTHCLYRDYN